MNNEETIYKIFKIFYHYNISEETINELEKLIIKHKIFNPDNYQAMKDGKDANYMYFSIKENRKKYSEIMYHYSRLLQNISILAKELNIENSLELSILYSYLLWNGYLSKNKEYIFNSKELERIPGLFFTDIINGKGVCLNNSEMLKDLLNLNEYKSVMMENHYNVFSKIDYNIDITRKSNNKEKNILLKLIEEIYKHRMPDHVFNLIEDNNKLYIYDSTNLLLHKIINSHKSTLINGKGVYRLFPYISHSFCTSKDEEKLLEKLLTEKTFDTPYTKEDLISTSQVNLEIIRNSTSLIEDFYTEVKPDMIGIAEETNKILQRTK